MGKNAKQVLFGQAATTLILIGGNQRRKNWRADSRNRNAVSFNTSRNPIKKIIG
jgi:hypothetical protein